MKKLLVLLFIIFLSFNAFAQEWTAISNPKPAAPTVRVLSCSEQETVVDFRLAGFCQEAVSTPLGTQHIITVPKMASMLEEGVPDLPLFAIPVLVDDRAEMKIQVEKSEYQDFENIGIAPSKGNFSREIDPEEVPFRYGEVYQHDSFFPDFQARLDQPYILRDCRGQNILVYPFTYNPVSKTLRVYTHLVLKMSKTGDNGANPQLSRKTNHKVSPEADAMYRHRFVNYREQTAKYNFVPDEGEMLVICPEQYLSAMQPFVDWKNASGRPTTMVSLSDAGGNNADQIKSFILSHYNNPNENLCYVLLVGDYADITPKSMNSGRSDIWFGQLEGNDYYPEVFVGRFSAESEADVEHQVAKVIYYERDIAADADWLAKGVGIGSTEGAGSGHNGGESDYQHIEYIRDTLLHYTYSEVSQHYQGVGVGTNAAMLSADFNAGAGICNYCNHGSATSWYVGTFTNSHVNALTNDYKWPFIWSTACLNGQFDTNCFAEAWMRATNNATGAPTGAIGGMFSWTSQPWQPPMTGQDEMVDVLCEWRNADQFHHTLGGASLNGNMKILDLHPSDQGLTHNTWILFGDPSLTLRTDRPTNLNLSIQPEAIFLGQTELRLAADADYAQAILSVDGAVIASAPIVNGEGTLVFESLEEVGTATLVVTGFNKVTEARTIDIIPANGAYLTYDSFSVNDANGQADYGETVGIDLTVKNIGNEEASNVQVTLSTDSPDVEVVNGSATIPNLGAMAEYTLSNGFQIAVSEHVDDGTQAIFTLTCTDGSHTWTSQFRMTLHAPAFALVEFRPEHTVNPGGNGQLLVGIKNMGTSDARDARLQLFSSSMDLSFGQVTHPIGTIPAGETATVSAAFSASSMISGNCSLEVLYHFEASNYGLKGIELLNIGTVKETFETGDFSAFDWETLGGSSWFIDNSTANTGTYSARTGAISHSNLTTLQVEMEVSEDGVISFFKKICTEANKDILTFYIDNAAKGEWSGEIDWSRETFAVTAGTHKFKWIYMKNGSGSYGDDCCWIDDVQFPTSENIAFLPPLALEAQVNLNEVRLAWQGMAEAEAYVVRLDGETVATQTGTTFTQWLNLGTFEYSVVAYNAQHQVTLPAFEKVEITTVGLDEAENHIQLYPNPVSDRLYLEMECPFTYLIFNAVGQQVAQGESNGKTQINCSAMPKGLYFMQIATEAQVFVKKIIVQ